jgi:hypothetical protein
MASNRQLGAANESCYKIQASVNLFCIALQTKTKQNPLNTPEILQITPYKSVPYDCFKKDFCCTAEHIP